MRETPSGSGNSPGTRGPSRQGTGTAPPRVCLNTGQVRTRAGLSSQHTPPKRVPLELWNYTMHYDLEKEQFHTATSSVSLHYNVYQRRLVLATSCPLSAQSNDAPAPGTCGKGRPAQASSLSQEGPSGYSEVGSLFRALLPWLLRERVLESLAWTCAVENGLRMGELPFSGGV